MTPNQLPPVSLRSRLPIVAKALVIVIAIASTATAWEISNPFVGVTYSKLRDDDVHPILGWSISPLSVDVMEIDLGAQGIDFITTPSNGTAVGHTTPQTTMQFMQETETQIAVNAAFFYYGNDGGCYSLGRHYSEGEPVNTYATPDFSSINITPDNVPHLLPWNYVDPVPYWNTFSGNLIIVSGGQVIDESTTTQTIREEEFQSHPRTAVGYNANENKLILMTVDGRQSSSVGVDAFELGELMVNFGATWALNLDGGGSTQMTMDNGTATYVNSPSETYRSVVTNVGVYATVDDTYQVFANFEHNNKGTFEYSPGYSGSTQGILESTSTTELVDTEAGEGQSSMKVTIYDDPSKSGEWFTRLVSGVSAARDQNVIRVAEGYVGLMAKTDDEGAFISLALDDPYTGDRGIRQSLIADGQWHWYQWDIDDDSQWESWIAAGDGVIGSSDFTLDSIQIWGTDDVVVYLDEIAHDSDAPLAPITPQIPGDANGDGRVDGSDVTILAGNWQYGVGGAGGATWAMGDFNGDGAVDGSDVTILAGNWHGVTSAAAAVPEPSMIALLLTCFAGLYFVKSRR